MRSMPQNPHWLLKTKYRICLLHSYKLCHTYAKTSRIDRSWFGRLRVGRIFLDVIWQLRQSRLRSLTECRQINCRIRIIAFNKTLFFTSIAASSRVNVKKSCLYTRVGGEALIIYSLGYAYAWAEYKFDAKRSPHTNWQIQ